VHRCNQEYLDKNYPGETCASDEEIDKAIDKAEIITIKMD